MKYTLKESLGIALEKWIFAILKNLFPASEGYRIMCPDWKNYNNHHGVDFRVFQGKKEILALECKNWRKLRKKYGLDIAQSEIIDRFHHVGTNNRLTVMSYSDVLTEPCLRAIRANGIKILNISKLIGYKDFKTSLFGELLRKIAALVKSPKGSSCSNSCSNSTLSCYCVSSAQATTKRTIPLSSLDPVKDPDNTQNAYELLKTALTLFVNNHG
jgi:hypothetical protein